MAEIDLLQRVEKFERTVATCLCTIPLLFSVQCFGAAIATPVFQDMFEDFGAKLPALTLLMFAHWPWVAGIAVLIPIIALTVARRGHASFSGLLSTGLGLAVFAFAQLCTLALFLPIWQLGEVAGNLE